MRRPVQPLPISPKLLKHFAAATVVLTGLIALFAGGEQSQIAQELAEREARNQLAQTEAEVIGTQDVGQPETTRTKGNWGSDGPENSGYSGASTDPNPPPMLAGRPPRGPQVGPMRGSPPYLTPPPGAAGSNARLRGIPVGDEREDASSRTPDPTSPTADQAAALLESSRARSGGSGDGD